MPNKDLTPFIKWVGGKRQILKKITDRMPTKYNNYIEPFVGGGALLFHLAPKKAIINDLNSDLINVYTCIKKDYKQLREYLLLMEYGHSEAFYTKIRGIDRNDPKELKTLNMQDSPLLRAARFIYLNKAGFNGLYRVNSKGEFNVPSGKKLKVNTHEFPNLNLISEFLSKGKGNDIKIRNKKFNVVCREAKKNDFVYLDPPYDYEEGVNGFDAYQKGGFGLKGQKQLAKTCADMHKKGVKFMVSNHNTALIRELYKDYTIDVIKVKRVVGSKVASRGDVEEVLIYNY